jgi:hypothetical protein
MSRRLSPRRRSQCAGPNPPLKKKGP